jgi:methyl-accepting chemotaxis protein
MSRNMGLGAKIGTGFALLILIAMGLGGLAVVKMKQVETGAQMLANEYVPEVAVANNIERTAFSTRLAVLGYGYTGGVSYLEEANEHIKELVGHIDTADKLAVEAKNLVALKDQAATVRKAVSNYQTALTETEKLTAEIAGIRTVVLEAGPIFVNEAAAFITSQNEAFVGEVAAGAEAAALLERVAKINLANDIVDVGNTIRIAAWRGQAERDNQVISAVMPRFDDINTMLDELIKTTRQKVNLDQIEAVRKAGNDYKTAMTDFLRVNTRMDEVAGERTTYGNEVAQASLATATAGMEGTDRIAQEASAALASASMVMIIGLIVALVIGIVLAIFITRSITGPVSRVIEGLTSGAEQVTSAASQVAGSSTSLAEGASEQASSLEETSASLEEMASMTRQTADNARQANEMASQAGTAAQKGITTMERMSDAIGRIKASSDETAKIIKTIDEIAFQTNLLALNAAVEAARAGDAGKGFAVVAEEVRNLAQRSAEAARNTSQLIQESQENADNGVKVSQDVGVVLQEIAGAASKVTQLVGEVSAATNEQTTGIEQVNNAVSQMDQVTQANAANSEEAASASEELSAQAGELNTMVDTLKAIVGGAGKAGANGHHAVAPRPARQAARPAVHAPMKALQHKAAKSVPAVHSGKQVVNPSQVIPLDDEDLEDF